MGSTTLDIRGYKITVQHASGSQLRFIERQLQGRTNTQLAKICDDAKELEQRIARRQYLLELNEALSSVEQRLREFVMDDQDMIENWVRDNDGAFDDFAEQDDGSKLGIIYPENASPNLDAAVHNLWEAQMNIAEELEDGNSD